ncbi:MAG TPA: hypothetical protein VFI11_02300 [Anaerolineales bacterium]|nr:hypothetical protein [Anaerolineales bacterium]
MTLYDVLEILGYILRGLGALVFGLGAGWLVMDVLKSPGPTWQLAIAVILGLLATFALLGHWVPGGATMGAFGLGAGAAILIWGLAASTKAAANDGATAVTRK